MQSIKHPGGADKLAAIKMDIRAMAAQLSEDDGAIDRHDVRAMLVRAKENGGGAVTRKDAEDLVFVRQHYADKFTKDALMVMDSVVGAFVADELQRMKEEQRKKKIEKHLGEIEERIELLLKDRKLREMDVDEKQRVMLTQVFGRAKRG